jgi:hypothetical protein
MSVRRRTSARRQLRARPPNAERYGPKIPHVKPTRERAEPEVRGRQQVRRLSSRFAKSEASGYDRRQWGEHRGEAARAKTRQRGNRHGEVSGAKQSRERERVERGVAGKLRNAPAD